ncbi:HNH endonuclease [bacterium]|nr:HNH endonuclease [bacterium]
MEESRRAEVIAAAMHILGRVIPASVLKTSPPTQPWIPRFHNLIAGIYKPAGWSTALSIRTSLDNPYEDHYEFDQAGDWIIKYDPRGEDLGHQDNVGLINCAVENCPVLVFKQKSNKQLGTKSTYEFVGPGTVEFNGKNFTIMKTSTSELIAYFQNTEDSEDVAEAEISSALLSQFSPFEDGVPLIVTSRGVYRNRAFRRVILEEYEESCAICESRFKLIESDKEIIEAQAAHIVPKGRQSSVEGKSQSGTDDPRNGVAMCHLHHWAFDAGLITINNDYKVVVSRALDAAEIKDIEIKKYAGKLIKMPKREIVNPHPLALDWHLKNIFKAS